MNGLVIMPSKRCTATRQAMRKEDEAEEESEATAHKSKMDENTTLISDWDATGSLKDNK